MTHSPNAIAALARAAIEANEKCKSGLGFDQIKAIDARQEFRDACNEATVLALVERLEQYTRGRRFYGDPMTTPLTPTAPEQPQ